MGDKAFLLAVYPYVLASTIAVSIVYWMWIWKTKLDPQMRVLVIGIYLLNLSLAMENAYALYFRYFGEVWIATWNLYILVPIKVMIAFSAYLHLHVFLSIRFRKFFTPKKWIAFGFMGFLAYPLLVVIFWYI